MVVAESERKLMVGSRRSTSHVWCCVLSSWYLAWAAARSEASEEAAFLMYQRCLRRDRSRASCLEILLIPDEVKGLFRFRAE